jgi:hypothetical protein
MGQLDLFGEALKAEQFSRVSQAGNQLRAQFCTHTIFLDPVHSRTGSRSNARSAAMRWRVHRTSSNRRRNACVSGFSCSRGRCSKACSSSGACHRTNSPVRRRKGTGTVALTNYLFFGVDINGAGIASLRYWYGSSPLPWDPYCSPGDRNAFESIWLGGCFILEMRRSYYVSATPLCHNALRPVGHQAAIRPRAD